MSVTQPLSAIYLAYGIPKWRNPSPPLAHPGLILGRAVYALAIPLVGLGGILYHLLAACRTHRSPEIHFNAAWIDFRAIFSCIAGVGCLIHLIAIPLIAIVFTPTAALFHWVAASAIYMVGGSLLPSTIWNDYIYDPTLCTRWFVGDVAGFETWRTNIQNGTLAS